MDTNLSDDMVKLVRYSIVNIQRDDESILHRGEEIVTDNMTDDAFAAWMISKHSNLRPAPGTGDPRKYLRVSYEVLKRWAKQDRKYERRQIEVLGEIRDAIQTKKGGGAAPAGQAPTPTPSPGGGGISAIPGTPTGGQPGGFLDDLSKKFSSELRPGQEGDPFFEFFNRLQLSRDTFDIWRADFKRCADRIAPAIAGFFNQYREVGPLKAPELDAAELVDAFKNPDRFDRKLFDMFTGAARGELRIYSPREEGEPEEAQAPPVHSIWGKVEDFEGGVVQRITGSNVEFIAHDDEKLQDFLTEAKVDLTVNLYTPELGIVSWSAFYQNHSNQMRSIGYQLGEDRLLWVNQLMTQDMKETVRHQLILSVDFESHDEEGRRFNVYAMHQDYDFKRCKVTFAGPMLKMINRLESQ